MITISWVFGEMKPHKKLSEIKCFSQGMLSTTENRISYTSSNSEQDCFTSYLCPWESYEALCFKSFG